MLYGKEVADITIAAEDLRELLRTPLMSLFTVDTDIIRAGVTYFNVIGFCYWLPCLTNGMQGYLRGIGQ